MIEITSANDKPVQCFIGYFLRLVEKSAKLAKVYMRMFDLISFCFFLETSKRKPR